MTDLSTRYLGLDLRTPIVASASPLNGDLATAKQVEDAGASAIVMPSLFEEEIIHEEIELNRALEAGSEHFAEALDYFPDVGGVATAGDRYLAKIEVLKAQSSVPVIASLNATSAGGWIRHASLHRGSRRRRARAQPVPRRRRPGPRRTDHGGRRPRSHPVGGERRVDPAGGQAKSLLLGHGQLRRRGRSTRAPTGSSSSTASTSPISISTRSRS